MDGGFYEEDLRDGYSSHAWRASVFPLLCAVILHGQYEKINILPIQIIIGAVTTFDKLFEVADSSEIFHISIKHD